MLDNYGHRDIHSLCSMTLLSHSLMSPIEGGVEFRTDHRIARFSHITFLAYIRSHLWLGELTERQGCTTPEFFFWQPTIGHIARFKVTETPSTNTGAGVDNSFSEFYKKARASVPEVDKIRKQLLETGTQGIPENPSLSGLQGSSFWGTQKSPFLVGKGRDMHVSGHAGRVGKRRERFLRTPAEVDYGRRRVQDRKGHFAGGMLPFSLCG